jgi:hypothetical protein
MRRYTYFFPVAGRKVCVGAHSEELSFSSIDTKRRSICASFLRIATLE